MRGSPKILFALITHTVVTWPRHSYMITNAQMYHLLVKHCWDEISVCLRRGEWEADAYVTDPSLGTKFPLLVCAAQDGVASIAHQLIELGANPNGRIIGAQTALILACGAGHAEIVKTLLSAGADPNLAWRRETPLMAAASRNRQDIVALLLKAGAQVADKDGKGRTALSWATHGDMIRFLLDQGCPVDGRDLHAPVMSRDLEIVRLLLSRKPDVNARFDWPTGGSIPHGTTPLHLIANDNPVELMIKSGAPLGTIKVKERLEMIELLLCAGADINAQDLKSGWTPLLLAINSDQAEIAAKLIREGADPNRQFECKIPPALRKQTRLTSPAHLSAIRLAQVLAENKAAKKLLHLAP